MDLADCTEDDERYSAREFSRLSPGDIARKRRLLVCVDEICRGKAFYRRDTRDGKAPCFGSNEHHPDCAQAGPVSRVAPGGSPQDQAELLNLGDRIHVVLTGDDPDEVHLDPDQPDGRKPSGRHVLVQDGPGARRAISQRKLLSLLRNLVQSEGFRRSDVEILVDGFPPMAAHEFFVRFADIAKARYTGKHRGYWGTIVDARTRSAGDALWLNSGSPDEPSVMIPSEKKAAFFRLHPDIELEDLAGAWVLALGTYQPSFTGKRLVKVNHASEIAVLLP